MVETLLLQKSRESEAQADPGGQLLQQSLPTAGAVEESYCVTIVGIPRRLQREPGGRTCSHGT